MKSLYLNLVILLLFLELDGQTIHNLEYHDFQAGLKKEMTYEEVKFKFGKPESYIRNGILVYVYTLRDSTEIVIGFTDKIRYAWHLGKDQVLLDQLFSIPNKRLTYKYFQENLKKEMNQNSIIDKFGLPDQDIGSGIYIYIYTLSDSTSVIIGFTNNILYARHLGKEKVDTLIE